MVLVGAAAFRGLTAASRSEAGAAASVTSRPSARFAGAKFAVRTATVPTATATIASPPNNIIRVLAIAPSPVREEPMDQLTCMLARRSEEHTSELQSLMRISYAVFCLKKKKKKITNKQNIQPTNNIKNAKKP